MKRCALWLAWGLAVCLGCEQQAATTPAPEDVEQVDESNFDEKVLGSPVPVLVDFYADWCNPCKLLAPLLEEMAGSNRNVKVVKVNVDESRQLAARYGVKGIPHLLVFRGGEVVAQHVGLANRSRLQSLLSQ
jgi:thioredoxin 1